MDWNWFFSSLAQSTAAIVGLFGAFIVTKIITNDGEHRRSRARIQELIHNSNLLRDRAEARRFHWYNEGIIAVTLDALWGQLTRERERRTPEEYYREHSFPPFVTKQELLGRIARLIEEHRQSGEQKGAFPRIQTLLSANAQEERERIDQLIVEIRQHIRLVRSLISMIRNNPEYSPAISYSIVVVIILFFAGVIYPLSFMPIVGSPEIGLSRDVLVASLFSLRGALLTIISAIFTATMAAFYVVNTRLRFKIKDIEPLREWGSLGAYSVYLAILEENEQGSSNQEGQASVVSRTANPAAPADG